MSCRKLSDASHNPIQQQALPDDELGLIDAYWRAANYLSVGQIYLLDNPLLKEPLKLEHIKPRLLGHWGTDLPRLFQPVITEDFRISANSFGVR